MSSGKLGAQVGHGAIAAYKISRPDLTAKWEEGGHTTKLVMQARDAEHLFTIERYLNDRGFATQLVIDEGRTEIPPFSPTVLGVEIVDKSDPHTLASFESFETYKDEKPELVNIIPASQMDNTGLAKRKRRWYHKVLGPWIFPTAFED